MVNTRRALHRAAVVGAALLVVVGSALTVAGTASATPARRNASAPGGSPAKANAVIRWYSDEVTLTLPARCQVSSCLYQLFVNEPALPGSPTVGTATGSSGTLTVAYPADFCGVLQADVLQGPPPWRVMFGHKQAVQTGDCTTTTTSTSSTSTTTSSTSTTIPTSSSSSTTSTSTSTSTTIPTSSSSSTTSTTVPSSPGSSTVGSTSTTVHGSSLPFTGGTDPHSGSGTGSTSGSSLPFTGTDVKPLAFLGMLLILAGLLILTTLEQRRRALRRLSAAVAASSLREKAGASARWFLGE